jgi:D-alanyl-D-alanine carboxypeptidase
VRGLAGENESTPVPGRRLLPALALAATLLALGAPAAHHAPIAHAAASSGHPTRLDGRTAALASGDLAVVRADGDCLRMREEPGLGAGVLSCLAEGSTVTTLAGTATLDGFAWREVTASALHGWVAERYIVAVSATSVPGASCGSATSTSLTAGISGGLPAGGGISLLLWGGGTAQGLRDAAVERGCQPRSVWATGADGGLIGYIFGAPPSVNRAWLALFPDGRIPAPHALLLRCEAPGAGSAAISAGSTRTLLPAASAAAPLRVGAATAPEVIAQAAIIVDDASGAVLFEKDAHLPLAPASLTKIATAIATLEGAELGAAVTSTVDARAMPGSSVMGLRPGDCFSVRDLLHGLLLPSGNDAALALGRYVAGSDEAFLTRLQTMLDRLGLDDTRFIDPHGLGGDGHASSAHDIAMLARYAMQLPDFAEMVTTRSWTATGARTLTMLNGNSFLTRYDGADGVKTGFTEEAGRTFAASATRDGRRLHVVLLNAPERFTDAELLLDWAFATFDWP